jgi:hypothetical protein
MAAPERLARRLNRTPAGSRRADSAAAADAGGGPVHLGGAAVGADRGRRFNSLGEDITPGLAPGSNAKLDWVIVGGESGPKARPMHPDWARSLRDQCAAAGVAFFFKQWGQFVPMTAPDWPESAGCVNYYNPTMKSVGKKAAGRHLDGALHDAMPAHSPKPESKIHGR